MFRKSADKKEMSESWKHLGGRGGAEGKYTRMARKRRPAGSAFEYMYLTRMVLVRYSWWYWVVLGVHSGGIKVMSVVRSDYGH